MRLLIGKKQQKGIPMQIKIFKKPTQLNAASLQDAYNKGMFTGSMKDDELHRRITKYNPDLIVLKNKDFASVCHKRNGFILGITRLQYHPQFSLFKYDPKYDHKYNKCDEYGEIYDTELIHTDDEEGKMFARSWRGVFKMLENKGFKIDWNGLI